MIIERKESVTQFRERSVTQKHKGRNRNKDTGKDKDKYTHTQTMAKEDSLLRGQFLEKAVTQ